MPRDKNNVEPEQDAGAPEWMVTFSDCMTLLLTFFVLLLSFSSFNKGTFSNLSETFGESIPGKQPYSSANRSTFVKQPPKHADIRDRGSTIPTQQDQLTNRSIKESDPKNFRTLRVFSMDSDEAFLASGKALSPKTKEILDAMSQYLKLMPSRIVISETGGSDENEIFSGYQRAFEIMDYLNKKGVPKNSMNITRQNMINKGGFFSRNKGRQLQITLLERSIYEP